MFCTVPFETNCKFSKSFCFKILHDVLENVNEVTDKSMVKKIKFVKIVEV